MAPTHKTRWESGVAPRPRTYLTGARKVPRGKVAIAKHRKRRLVTTVGPAAESTLRTSIPAEIVRSKGIESGDRLVWEGGDGWVRFKVKKVVEEDR